MSISIIDPSIRIIDRLIRLFEIRVTNRQQYFDNYVDPIFKDAELIVKDYLNLFKELIPKLEDADNAEQVIKWIEDRRIKLLDVRIKMRSFLKNIDKKKLSSIEKSMDKFQRGIWSLIRGGLSFVEEGHLFIPEYNFEGHTILDILYLLSQEPFETNRDKFIRIAKAQRNIVQSAWQDTTDGYAEIKKSVY